MTVELKFKKQFLYSDKAIQQQKEQVYNLHLENLNNVISESEIVLKRDLTDPEKNKIKEVGTAFIFEEVKSKFPFASADDKFNLEALGVDLKPLEKVNKAYTIQDYEATLLNGRFTPSEKELTKIKEASKVYTTNEKQNNALKFSEEIIEVLNDAEEKDLRIEKSFVSSLFKGLHVLGDKIEVNKKQISVM